MIERKSELGRDLQQRANLCAVAARSALGEDRHDDYDRLRGKACAYEHAAELADAAQPTPTASVRELPEGWVRLNRGVHPRVRLRNPRCRVSRIAGTQGGFVYTHASDTLDVRAGAVVSATFIAALDAAK